MEQMPRDEFVAWMAYYDIEPWGCDVEDQRTQVIASLIFQANSKPGTKTPRFFERDIQPKPKSVTKRVSSKVLDDKFRNLFAGRIVKAESAELPPPPESSPLDK